MKINALKPHTSKFQTLKFEPMKTDDLIDFLSRGETPLERPHVWRTLAIALVAGLVIAIGLVTAAQAVRPDIGAAITPVMLKAGFAAALAAIALPLLLSAARPGRPLRARMLAALGFVIVALIVGGVALMGLEPHQRMRAWTGGGFPWCLVFIPVLAAPTAAGLVWLVRGLAPTSLAKAGAAIGAVAGGIGAMAYAMYCPVDSLAFVTTWYSLAIAACAALGAILGGRILRW
ncbi:MAG: DUF1109 domain-containing protein [Hyphomonadaceae bacterium]|nr:DUF1109 domain-containing protein [Hyphomonadaceae bacterium]